MAPSFPSAFTLITFENGKVFLTFGIFYRGLSFGVASCCHPIVIWKDSSGKVEEYDGGTAERHASISGGDVQVTANNKGRVAVSAGGVSVGKGTSVGVGASFAYIRSKDSAFACVGSCTVIDANTLVVKAEKARVTMDDYKSAKSSDQLHQRFLRPQGGGARSGGARSH